MFYRLQVLQPRTRQAQEESIRRRTRAQIRSRCFHDYALQGLVSSRSKLTLLTDGAIKIQGTKVLETREIRKTVRVTREGAPQNSAYARIIKYDGREKNPQWMDVERGTIFDFVM